MCKMINKIKQKSINNDISIKDNIDNVYNLSESELRITKTVILTIKNNELNRLIDEFDYMEKEFKDNPFIYVNQISLAKRIELLHNEIEKELEALYPEKEVNEFLEKNKNKITFGL